MTEGNNRHIDHHGIEPVYLQLADILRDRIAAGEIPPGGRLPSETDIMDEYSVARLTARRAFRVLADEGLTITVQGRGSYVKTPDEPEG
jgi:DNA-binding GntR family transcriptional regulator